MAKTCEVCGRKLHPTDPSDRYCRQHAMKKLREAEASGYFQPLEEQTISGKVVLSKRRFLTVPWSETLRQS